MYCGPPTLPRTTGTTNAVKLLGLLPHLLAATSTVTVITVPSVTPDNTRALREGGLQSSGTQHSQFWWRLISPLIAASPMESTKSDSRRCLRFQPSGSEASPQMHSWRACSCCRSSFNWKVLLGFPFRSSSTSVISSLKNRSANCSARSARTGRLTHDRHGLLVLWSNDPAGACWSCLRHLHPRSCTGCPFLDYVSATSILVVPYSHPCTSH